MSPARHPVRALILTPTRELAVQVAENVKAYAKHTPLRSTVVFGGMDMKPQTVILRGGVEIVIATPGRLLDHIEQKNISLSQVQMLVMDEADRMLDMGFLPDLQRIINLLPKQRQNLMFSATFSPEIKKLAATFLNDPLTIEVARSNQTADKVTQVVYKVTEDQKHAVVAHLLRQRDLKQVIIFSNTKIGASRLARVLEQEGFVRSVPRRGIFVVRKTKRQLLEMITVWAALESMAARLAATRATPVELKGLRRLFNEFEREPLAAHVHEYSQANIVFHQAVIRMGGNALIVDMTENLFLHMRAIRAVSIRQENRFEASMREHMAIIDALERRDPDLAERLVREHTMGLAAHVEKHGVFPE